MKQYNEWERLGSLRALRRGRLLSTTTFWSHCMNGFSSSRAMGWLFFLIAGICVWASYDSTLTRCVCVESSVSLACDVDAASTQPVYDLWGTIVDAFDVWDGVMPSRRARVLGESSSNGVFLVKTIGSAAKRFSSERRGLAYDLWTRCVASCDGRVCRYLVFRILRN